MNVVKEAVYDFSYLLLLNSDGTWKGFTIILIRIDPNHELIQIENGLYIRFYETPSNCEA